MCVEENTTEVTHSVNKRKTYKIISIYIYILQWMKYLLISAS